MKFVRHAIELSLITLFLGCTNSYTIMNYEEVSIPKKAIIETMTSGRILAENIIVRQDSVFATEFPGGQKIRLHASDIIRILQKRNDAMKFGAMGAVGTVAWVVFTAPTWNDDNNSGYTFFWSAILAAPAGVAGALVGSLHSYEYSYLFESNEKTTVP